MMRTKYVALCALVISAATAAHAATITGDLNAPTSNFGAPGTTATYGYTITASDNGTSFIVTVASLGAVPSDVLFGNIYIDSTASTPGSGSDIGFSWNASANFGFIPGGISYIDYAGTGITSSFTQDASGDATGSITIPNTFFLTGDGGLFAPTPDGTDASIHYSQSLGYSFVGGGSNYAYPAGLGDAAVTSTPEPSSLALLGTGVLGAAGMMRRRFKK